MEGKKISKHLLDDSLKREIENKSDEGHRHTESDILGLDKYTTEEVDNLLDGKANTVHTHTEDDIEDLDKYTKAETDDLLQNKANKIHTHTESDIEDLDKYSRQEVDSLLSEKLDKTGNLSWEQITDKPKLAHGSWRSPVATFDDLPKTGNLHEDVRMVLSGEYANHVFKWNANTEEWELIGVNDTNIEWDNIQAKPSTFPPEPHEHTESDITDLDKYSKIEVDNLLNEKSDKNHTHDELHTHSNKDVLDNITQTGTETTFDLSSFETKGHQHSEDDIIDLDKYTKAEVDNLLDGKSDEGHTHSELHEHNNKSVLDKVIETEDYETYDLSQISILDQRMADIESGHTEGHAHHNLDILDQIDYTGPEITVDLIKMEENEHQINQLKQNKADQSELNAHKENQTIHVTQTDKDNWNNAGQTVAEHLGDDVKHITSEERSKWNGKADGNHEHPISDIDGLRSELDSKASTSIAVGEYRTSTLSVSISPGKIRKKSLFVGSDVVKVIVDGVGRLSDTFEIYKGGDYGLRNGSIFRVNMGYANGGDFSNARRLGEINSLGVYLCDIYLSGYYLRIDLGSEYDRKANEELKFLVYNS